MPIKVTCSCHASFHAKEELAGKTVKCPRCQQPLHIPRPAIKPDDDWADLVALEQQANTIQKKAPEYTSAVVESQPLARAESKSKLDTSPRSSKSSKPRKKRSSSRNFFSIDGGKILGGIAMMVGAAVWFGLGLMAGYIFFYPPVLFILGGVSLVNGLLGSD